MKTNRFRTQVIIFLIALILVTVSLFACAQATSPEQIELVLSSPMPPMAPPAAHLQAWADKLKEASGGQITCKIYFGSSLFASTEALESLKAGIADACHIMIGDFPTVFELGNYISLPFLGLPSPEAAGEIHRKLLDKFPEMRDEYKGLKLLYPACFSEANFWVHTTKKQVLTGSDLKGMKFLGMLPTQAQWLQIMGATAVAMAPEDIYTSTEKGLIDGMLGGYGQILGQGVMPLLKYHTNVGSLFDMGYDALCFNLDRWNSFSPKTQKIFTEMSAWYYTNRNAVEAGSGEAGIAEANKLGHITANLSPDEMKRWMEAAKPMHQDWIAKLEAKGKPAQEIYNELQKLITDYK